MRLHRSACWTFAALALSSILLLRHPVAAQMAPAPSEPADRNSPAHHLSIDAHMVVAPDLSATTVATTRLKVLRESAIRVLGQQSIPFNTSLASLEILEAFTEKPDGRKLMVEPTNILTRDAATGLNAIYQRDAKVMTLVFPDVEVGDTLVYVSRVIRSDARLPGHFFFSLVLPRSVPYAAYRLAVDVPKSLALRTHAKGDGLTLEVAEAGHGKRHVFHYKPKVWSLDEPNAVAAWDRDPQLVITTFGSMAELGAGYWSRMKGDDRVSPAIQALAEEITKGVDGRRAQAEAIERWVKKNIRYVLVFLGSGGFTPNPASTVLKNKFGDCKDHVALMGALLKAKGIPSEQVLVSMSNMYRLPELPTPLFNHVMLYLPEVGVYTDPTASSAAFGVLPESSYDKPVLHISEAGGRPARTPPMKAEDHVTTTRTIVSIAADGTIKGETRQTATGVFASSARRTVAQIETQGREKYAENLLRGLGHPGTGIFEPATPSDLSEPYNVQGSFALHEKMGMPLDGWRNIPFGMPIHRRPGVWPLGQRVPNRTSDFSCFAARQVEEIEVTFSEGLPLPRKLRGSTIDTLHFSYRSNYDLAGRTLKIRREFTSKVAGQVCAKEIEAELGEPLQRVARSLRSQMSFAANSKDNDAPGPD
jgi:transglutaminase-like putative cysteine protease